MYLNRAYRQIALVCYGNEYLNGAVESELLDRHPLLFDHFPILRSKEHGTLLCGSASHMLYQLKTQGATKLSLHIASDLKLGVEDSDLYFFSKHQHDFCIAVHFNQWKFKILLISEEKATLQSSDENGYKEFYNYSNYYHHTEAFTLHEINESAINVIQNDLAPIKWDDFFSNIESNLYCNDIAKKYGIFPISLDTNNCYEGDLFQRNRVDHYPLLPFTIRKNYASNLIFNTAILDRQYQAASNCKNDNSDYFQMDHEEKKNFDIAVQNLENLHPIILKYCANQYHESGFLNTNYFSGSSINLDPNFLSNYQIPIESNLHSDKSQFSKDINTSSIDSENQINDQISTFSIFGLIKFFWYLIWCYS